MHVAPHTILFAFPIGLWLGILAWRTGSVWPCIACHAFINGSWNVYQLGTRLGYFPDPPPLAVLIGGGVLIVGCFGATVWWLVRGNHLQKADPA